MLKALYRAIRDDNEGKEIVLQGRTYTTQSVYEVLSPEPTPLTVTTLTGITDYIHNNVDKLEIENLICHVVSPSSVRLFSRLTGDFEQRKPYIEASLEQLQLHFNTFMDGEEFNILLQSCFIDSYGRADVLKYTAHTKQCVEGGTLDDGVTQTVTVKVGIASVANVPLPNPVTLQPYRTFIEVEQPASKFVFRAKEGPKFALIEADGGAWKSEAMKNIKDHLELAIPELAVLA